MGRKVGAAFPFLGVGSASNTVSPGPRNTSVASAILIHPAFWPQQTWAGNWRSVPFWGELGPHLTQCGLLGCELGGGLREPYYMGPDRPMRRGNFMGKDMPIRHFAVNCAKMVEPIEMRFCGLQGIGPRKHVLRLNRPYVLRRCGLFVELL